jgi:NADP-dependent 3-hydroxy acid dehydrogenase YdfG
MMALKDRFRDTNLKISAIYPGGFESNIYENSGSEEGGPEHNLPWMMTTETVANAVIFMLSQSTDVNVDELIITKHLAAS